MPTATAAHHSAAATAAEAAYTAKLADARLVSAAADLADELAAVASYGPELRPGTYDEDYSVGAHVAALATVAADLVAALAARLG